MEKWSKGWFHGHTLESGGSVGGSRWGTLKY